MVNKKTKVRLIRFINRIMTYKLKRGYTIHVNDNGTFSIVKIINVYDNRKDAQNDMVMLVTNNITEYELLKKYTKNG